MRYIPVEELREGMLITEDIYDASGRLLLGRDTKLTRDNITYLTYIGIAGVYIYDERAKDVVVENIVEPEIRRDAIRLVRDTFGVAEGVSSNNNEVLDGNNEIKIRQHVEAIVDSVLKNEHVMYNLVQLKTYDGYTYFHSVNVAVLAGIIGTKHGLDTEELDELVTAGFLHDIGKIFVDPDILNAPRKLTEEERKRMLEHPRLGYEFLVKNYNFPPRVSRAVYEHHEWWNGHGYPNHYKGNELLRISTILKAADVYDAMTTKRPYHRPYFPSEVIEYMMGRSGMEFSPAVIDTMVRELCIYPVGCEVILSDGRHAIVQENHTGYVLRPTIKILDTGESINLKTDRASLNVTIVKLLM